MAGRFLCRESSVITLSLRLLQHSKTKGTHLGLHTQIFAYRLCLRRVAAIENHLSCATTGTLTAAAVSFRSREMHVHRLQTHATGPAEAVPDELSAAREQSRR